jgi:CHASE1-domain containing sensor protein
MFPLCGVRVFFHLVLSLVTRLVRLLGFISHSNSLDKALRLTDESFRIKETAKWSLPYRYTQVEWTSDFSYMLKCCHMAHNTFDINFDLPEVASSAPTKPRIHMASESVCVSCEG